MLTRIAERPAFHVVGVKEFFTPATMSEIPAVWGRFVPRLGEVRHQRGDLTYGICQDGANGQGTFAYTASIEASSLADVPDGMVGFTVPAAVWAVVTHRGHISKITETFDAIFAHGLADAKVERAGALDLEVYDEQWDPATGMGDVEIHIPIKGRPRSN